jgi:3-dehydroquinate synthase
MNRCIVTGAQGFIGRWLTLSLLREGVRVWGVGRSERDDAHFTHSVSWNGVMRRAPLTPELRAIGADPGYSYRSLDLAEGPGLAEWIAEIEPDVVFHLAGSLRDESTSALWRNNVLGTQRVLEAVATCARPPQVLFGSSGIIGADPAGRRLPVPDDAPPHPLDGYSISKYAAEQTARMIARTRQLDLRIARIFNVVGPGQEERHVCGRLASQFAEIEQGARASVIEVGALEPTRDFVDVRDVAAMLVAIARRGASGTTYNVASGIEVSVQRVLDDLVAIFGRAPEIRRLPLREAEVARHVADVSRLSALGAAGRIGLRQSLEDVLAYYRALSIPLNGEPHPATPRASALVTVTVERRDSYPVEVEAGALEDLPQRLAASHPRRRHVVLTDATVYDLHARHLIARAPGHSPWDHVLAPCGESAKTFDVHREIIERLYALGHDRRSCLVCVGGGAVMDLGGFVAATFLRGTAYLNVPTTLVAMHDAAIGGKVAVNTPWAKNFVGAFHHPERVVCDPSVLRTLPARMMSSGVAEAIKVAIIGDPRLFDTLVTQSDAIMGRDPDVLQEVVRRAAEVKVRCLAPDPLERDLRRPLNLGHTVGHPLETHLGPERISHGEAVAAGMIVATRIAERRGVCAPEVARRIQRALALYGLPPALSTEDLRGALNHLGAVRLVRAGKLHFVLPREIGRVEIVEDLPIDELGDACDYASAHSAAL